MSDQREKFAAQIEGLLEDLDPMEYPLKAQKMWEERTQTTPPQKKEEQKKEPILKNEKTEVIATSQGPIRVSGEYLQNIGAQRVHLQQAPMYGDYYQAPQEESQINDYSFPQPEQAPQYYGSQQQPVQQGEARTYQAPQVEALINRLKGR